jgi:hypothetical protein
MAFAGCVKAGKMGGPTRKAPNYKHQITNKHENQNDRTVLTNHHGILVILFVVI